MTAPGRKPQARGWAGPDPALDFDVWNAHVPQDDELLACVAELAAIFERPFVPARVTRGLALDEQGFVRLTRSTRHSTGWACAANLAIARSVTGTGMMSRRCLC